MHALALRDEVLFVGGGGTREEFLGRVDLRAAAPAFAAMPIPAEVRSHGKSIDALLFDGDRLLAVDDFLDPKWFPCYDVAAPREPRYLEARPLDPDSTGHVVHAAALADRHVAVARTSYNHGRATTLLELFLRDTLAPRSRIHARAREQIGRRGVSIDATGRQFPHLDARGELLLVCAGVEGLALADLRAIDPPGAGEPAPAAAAAVEASLRWVKFPDRAAVRAFLIDPGRALVSLRDGRGRHEVRIAALEDA